MKQLLMPAFILLFFTLSISSFAQEKIKATGDKIKVKTTDTKMSTTMDQTSYPYKATYSSNFKVGNPAQAKKILELWKDWDDNAFDRHNYFADTIEMYFPDGSMVHGKDSALAGAKRFRGSMSSATSVIQAWTPLKSVDRNQDWVLVWGTETDTYPDGKTDVRDLHEIWRFNKDGKLDFMKQFASAGAKQ